MKIPADFMKLFKKLKNNFWFLNIYLLFHLYNPFKKYGIKTISDQNSLLEIFKLRYRIYCLTDKLLKPADYPDGIEKDEYDESSVHFAAFDQTEKTIGTLRLIKNSTLGFPTEKEFNLQDKLKNISHSKMVELSRFLIEKDYRGSTLMLDLAKAMYLYSKQNNINYWLGCSEEWLMKKMNALWGPIEIINNFYFLTIDAYYAIQGEIQRLIFFNIRAIPEAAEMNL